MIGMPNSIVIRSITSIVLIYVAAKLITSCIDDVMVIRSELVQLKHILFILQSSPSLLFEIEQYKLVHFCDKLACISLESRYCNTFTPHECTLIVKYIVCFDFVVDNPTVIFSNTPGAFTPQ
jgi:hypothetical protein